MLNMDHFKWFSKTSINNGHYGPLLSSKVKTPTNFTRVMTTGSKEQQLEVKKLHIIALWPEISWKMQKSRPEEETEVAPDGILT